MEKDYYGIRVWIIVRFFYSDNGSTAVEVALKMAIQRENLRGSCKRKLLAFQGAYHGDTFGAMALGERGLFTRHFQSYFFEVTFMTPPTPGKENQSWEEFQQAIAGGDVGAFIFEPLLQGSAGMVVHDSQVLNRMVQVCQTQGITTIADEVMTGFYRTGHFRASAVLDVSPDLLCFSKGITGGVMPLGATVCHQDLVEAFRPATPEHIFFHGHSYTGNPLALSLANASLDLLERPEVQEQIRLIQKTQKQGQEDLSTFVANQGRQHQVEIRCLGTMLAMEIRTEGGHYLHSLRERLYLHFLEQGILLRPLGNIVYTLPPYCSTSQDLSLVHEAMKGFLEHL